MQVEPGGGADHRVLLVTETLKGFPALLQIALPLLFVEGVRRFLLCARAKEDLPAAPPLRYLRVAEVKRRARRIWGGRTHASLQAGCGYRSGCATPRHSNSKDLISKVGGVDSKDSSDLGFYYLFSKF